MRPRALAALIPLAVAAAAALAACDPPPITHRYAITFAGRTDAGAPLGGVAITANGAALGVTGPDGALVVDVRAVEGKLLRVTATCPEGFRAAAAETEVRLRRLAGAARGAPQPVVVNAECRPRARRAAILVRTPGLAGVPVRYRDREVARTDGDGVAHVLLELAPQSRLQLALDTTAHPRLRPRDPTAEFVLGDADEVFVFDYQPAVTPLPPRKKKARRAPPPPPGPVKIESVRPKRGRARG